MFRYRVAVPVAFSDELVIALAHEATANLEAVVPAPADLHNENALSPASSGPMAVLLVYGPNMDSLATMKMWLDSRRSEHPIDVRGEGPPGRFTYSFHSHSLEEIMEWAYRTTQNPAAAGE